MRGMSTSVASRTTTRSAAPAALIGTPGLIREQAEWARCSAAAPAVPGRRP